MGDRKREGRARDWVDAITVDASQCLEGNPLAHLLDGRAFKQGPGWRVDKKRSEKPNATLLPFCDNTTGRVYVVVLTLRAISVSEDVCIDYGEAYWDDKRDHDRFVPCFGLSKNARWLPV